MEGSLPSDGNESFGEITVLLKVAITDSEGILGGNVSFSIVLLMVTTVDISDSGARAAEIASSLVVFAAERDPRSFLGKHEVHDTLVS